MNASKAGDVGQILRRRGISRKTRMKAQMLFRVSTQSITTPVQVNLQADYAEEDNPVEVENVGDS